MRRARRVDVELEDVPLDGADPRPSEPPVERRRRWWWLAVPVAAALALVGAQAVTDRRESAELAALADVPGVLHPIDGVVEVAWTVSGGTRLGGTARVGSVLVTTHVTADHAVALEGLDVATGSSVWRHDVLGPRTGWSPEADPANGRCAVVPDSTGQVACLVSDAGSDVVDGQWTSLPPTTARLVVLDADDGSAVTDREVPVWVQEVTPSGGDVLLAGHLDGALHVRSQSLVDGSPRWDAAVEPTEAGRAAGASADAIGTLLDARTLAVQHGDAVTLVSTDGVVLRTVGAPSQPLLTGQASTTRIVPSTALGAVLVGGESSTTVASATLEVPLDGSPLPVLVDDGSVPGLVLTRTPFLQAWDAQDGAARWQTTVVDAQDATVLHGRVHVGTSAWLVTYDGATGEELWRWPRPTGTGTPLTDGRYLYVPAMRDALHSAPYDLVALHVADGSEVWRTPLPEYTWLMPLHGLLLTQTVDTGTLGATFRLLR